MPRKKFDPVEKHHIDYSKPFDELIWDCAQIAARYILRRSKARFNDPQVYEDCITDMCIAGIAQYRKNELRGKGNNHDYPLANIMFGRVYSRSYYVIKKHIEDQDRQLNTASLDAPLDDLNDATLGDLIPATNDGMIDYVGAYGAYTELCRENGMDPVDFNEFSGYLEEF